MGRAGVADAFCPDCDRNISNAALPAEVEISVPEGFAYYALDPELYRIAVRRFVEAEHPTAVAVIGIRSTGAPVAAGTGSGIVRRKSLAGTKWSLSPRTVSMTPGWVRRASARTVGGSARAS